MKQTLRCAARVADRVLLIAALGALTALLCASIGVQRERGRRSVCMSHLRGIGRAIAMYSQDYGGLSDPKDPSEMALPPSLETIVSEVRPGARRYGLDSPGVFHCPDAPADPAKAGDGRCDYLYQRWPANERLGAAPPFAVALARRGMAFPIVLDRWHEVRTPS